MLRSRRGAILLLVLGVAAVVLALLGWGASRVAWSRAQTRAEWDRVVLEFAAVEVERAAQGALVTRAAAAETAMFVTSNRLVGRFEARPVSPPLWRVRWGVGGSGGLWREGGWFTIEAPSPPSGPAVGILTPLPGLPPAR